MGNVTYDEYIRSILGYPHTNSYNNYQNYSNQNNYNSANNNSELEKCYPEIYKIVYPMITKKCANAKQDLTKEDIENMTDEIYYALEETNNIQLNINLGNNIETSQTINSTKTANKKTEVKVSETTGEKRQTRQMNSGLRDLIKILLIKELLNRPGNINRPPRPPMPPSRPPMRPPFTQGGIFNREFETPNYDIFEY